MKKIGKYTKRNKQECIWDLGLYILLTVVVFPLREKSRFSLVFYFIYFLIHAFIFFFRGAAGRVGVVLGGFVCFCFYCLDNNQSGVPLSPPFKSYRGPLKTQRSLKSGRAAGAGAAPGLRGAGGARPGGPPERDPQTRRGLSFEAYISVPSLEA